VIILNQLTGPPLFKSAIFAAGEAHPLTLSAPTPERRRGVSQDGSVEI
jgi:hypothetical protein